MNMNPPTPRSGRGAPAAFALTDLVVIIGIVFILLGLAMPVLANGRTRSGSALCVANARQMVNAWQLYAAEHDEQLVNNYDLELTLSEITRKTFRNWVNNVMTWGTSGTDGFSVTNLAWVRNGKLSPHLSDPVAPFRCPADRYVSSQQRARGWTGRARSISMNAFLGSFRPSPLPAGYQGGGYFYPAYRQFLKIGDLRRPAGTIVTLDEQADSINDGILLNNPDPLSPQWSDLPAFYHNGACTLSFADSHVELHRFRSPRTRVPVSFQFPKVTIEEGSRDDYRWFMERMTEPR